MRNLAPVFLATLALAACGGDDGGALGGDVVGSWRSLPSSFSTDPPPVAERQVLTFAADGTYTSASSGSTSTGTYQIDGGDLVGTSSDGKVSRTPYHASATRLVFGALTSDTGGAELPGTWTGHVENDGVTMDVTLILRADQSAHLYQQRSDGNSLVVDGTWAAQGDDVAVSLMIGTSNVRLLSAHVDGVLGSPFERL